MRTCGMPHNVHVIRIASIFLNILLKPNNSIRNRLRLHIHTMIRKQWISNTHENIALTVKGTRLFMNMLLVTN